MWKLANIRFTISLIFFFSPVSMIHVCHNSPKKLRSCQITTVQPVGFCTWESWVIYSKLPHAVQQINAVKDALISVTGGTTEQHGCTIKETHITLVLFHYGRKKILDQDVNFCINHSYKGERFDLGRKVVLIQEQTFLLDLFVVFKDCSSLTFDSVFLTCFC